MTLTDVHKGRQKLGTILENKVVQKLKFSKNDNNKKPSSKLIFFNEKKIRKIRMIFDIDNWLWKSDLGTFWHPMRTSVKVKSKKYFSFTDFFTKIKPLLTHVRKPPSLRSHYSCSAYKPTQHRRQQDLRAYCPDIYTVILGLSLLLSSIVPGSRKKQEKKRTFARCCCQSRKERTITGDLNLF